MKRHWFRLSIPTLGLCAALAGCGEKSPPQGEATGRVLIDGEPLAAGIISLYEPTIGWGGEAPIKDGVFSLSISEAGLRAGNYQVAIHPPVEQVLDGRGEVSSNREAESPIPKSAREHRTSGLTAEIHPGKNTLTFEISTKAPPK